MFQGLEDAFLTSVSLKMKIVMFTPKEVWIMRELAWGEQRGIISIGGEGAQKRKGRDICFGMDRGCLSSYAP